MIKKYYLSINSFLVVFGIFLSFFYFGGSKYFYPKFEIMDIFTSTFIVTCAFTVPLVAFNFFFNKDNLTKNLFNSLFVGIVVFLTYHYTIRFADLNYFYIYDNFFSDNFNLKIFFYIYPFLLAFIFTFFSKKNFFLNLNKFILIFLIILNIFSIIRIYNIYNIDRFNSLINTNDFKNFEIKEKKVLNYKTKKVIFLVFDEFDQIYFEKNLKNFDILEKLYNSSYVNKDFFTPAMYTIDSIPAILTGNSTKKTKINNGNLSFYNLENQQIHFNYENSLFNNKRINNFSSSIFATYHPYCKIFKVENCYDVFNFSKSKITLKKSFYIFFEITYLNRLIDTSFLSLFNKLDTILFPLNIINDNQSKFMVENANDFLINNSHLIYVHFPYPHPPLKTKGIIKFEKDLDKSLTDYEKNLWLIEQTLLNMKTLDKLNDSLLIVTSDHWYREDRPKKPYPSVFFSKIIGDNTYYENIAPNNASGIKELINLFFSNKINNNFDIKKFFDKQVSHDVYVR